MKASTTFKIAGNPCITYALSVVCMHAVKQLFVTGFDKTLRMGSARD
jgi:hypothetical protein